MKTSDLTASGQLIPGFLNEFRCEPSPKKSPVIFPVVETKISRKNGSSPPAFLEKLYDIMENASLQPYISWQPDGLSFLIKDVQAVSEFVLPHYFKHNNIQSFVRQLNMYNFTKTRHDSNFREFRQPLFQRDRRDLLSAIKRKSQVSVEKVVALKRKYNANENRNDANYSLATNHGEKAVRSLWDGEEECSGEELCSSSSCSSDGETERKRELEELTSCMSDIESHIWFLSEQYNALSASYRKMRGSIDRFQTSSPSSVVISACKEERLKNSPSLSYRTEIASDTWSKFREATSRDCASKDPEDKLAQHRSNHFANRCLPFSDSSAVSDKENPFLVNKQQYLNIQESADDEVISTEVGKSGSKYMDEGEGLDAMAAAASLRCVFPNSRSNNRPSARSSLADLLDAATFR